MKTVSLSFASLLLATSAIAQAVPGPDELSGRLSGHLPSYWTVEAFRLIAQSDVGDAARPQSVIRFEADTTPTSPLYVQVEQQEPFAIVAATHYEGVQRTLYGVMDLTYRAGEWAGEVEIENPVAGLGRPADLFDRPVLVLGDPEGEARIEQLRQQRESNAIARFERQLSKLRNEQQTELETAAREHAAELSRLTTEQNNEMEQAQAQHRRASRQLAREHQDEIANLSARHAAAVAALNNEQQTLEGGLEAEVAALRQTQAEELAAVTTGHEETMRNLEREQRAALESARAEHRAAMDALERELRTELLALTEGLEPDVEAARQEHARTLAELRRTQDAELEEVRVEHARARGQMRERLREEIAAAELELASEVDRLRGQLGRSEEAQALQAAFLESVRVRSAAAVELQRELETALARRVSVVQRLPQQYEGGVRCRDSQSRIDRSWQLSLGFNDINPSGMTGRFRFDGSGRSQSNGTANLVIRSDEFALPLQARLSLAGAGDAGHLPNTIDLVISENVVMRGTETTSWTIDNAQVQVSCVFEFS